MIVPSHAASVSIFLPGCDDVTRQIDLDGGRHMLRVNSYLYYQLAIALKPVADLADHLERGQASLTLLIAKIWVEAFQKNPVSLPLTGPLAIKLLKEIETLDPAHGTAETQKETIWTFSLKNTLKEFETLLNNELNSADIYHVDQKGIFSTTDLIDHADKALPGPVRSRLSAEAMVDVKSAGRCLAFDLPTAAGFHIMRAAEDVLLDYSAHFVGSRPSRGNWNQYLTVLKDTSADGRVVAVLNQIRDLHRNPVMHPEVTLDGDEATTLFSVAVSSIIAMENDIVAQPSPKLPTVKTARPAKQSKTGSSEP